MGLYENLKICSGKGSVRKMKRQAMEQEKTHISDKGLVNCTSDKRLVPRVYKGLSKLNSKKKQIVQLSHGQKA